MKIGKLFIEIDANLDFISEESLKALSAYSGLKTVEDIQRQYLNTIGEEIRYLLETRDVLVNMNGDIIDTNNIQPVADVESYDEAFTDLNKTIDNSLSSEIKMEYDESSYGEELYTPVAPIDIDSLEKTIDIALAEVAEIGVLHELRVTPAVYSVLLEEGLVGNVENDEAPWFKDYAEVVVMNIEDELFEITYSDYENLDEVKTYTV